MTAVAITVRGSHTTTVPPEQAIVHASVAGEGAEPQPVFDAVATALAEVTSSLESRHHPKSGPVTRLVVDQIHRGSHRPYNHEGKQLPLVYTASVTVTATFVDFDELASWVGSTVGAGMLSIGYIEWALTPAKRLRVERRTRQKAVRDARRRAQDYADALDLGPVVVRSVSDPGMGGQPRAKMMLANAMSAPPGGAPEVSLRPEDVVVEAQVEATFEVAGST